MNNESIINYSRFIRFVQQAGIVCQTELVTELLRSDKQLRFYNDIHNLYMFTAELSTGTFYGTIDQLSERQRSIEKQISDLRAVLSSLDNHNAGYREALADITAKLHSIEDDLQALEHPREGQQQALEWWLVPYWIADQLMIKGAMVFRQFGNNWWGRANWEETIFNDTTLLEIFCNLQNCKIM